MVIDDRVVVFVAILGEGGGSLSPFSMLVILYIAVISMVLVVVERSSITFLSHPMHVQYNLPLDLYALKFGTFDYSGGERFIGAEE